MSTNFFARSLDCSNAEELHIGKCSLGWDFLFRAYPDRGLISSIAWYNFLCLPDVQIVSEYGDVCTLEEFWEYAVRRREEGGIREITHVHVEAWRQERGRLAAIFASRQWTDELGRPFADYEFC